MDESPTPYLNTKKSSVRRRGKGGGGGEEEERVKEDTRTDEQAEIQNGKITNLSG